MKINIKLTTFFVLLFVLVPTMLMIPLHQRVEAIEKVQRNELVVPTNDEKSNEKKVCMQAAKNKTVARKASCQAS